MSRFTLVVTPDGRALLTSPGPLEPSMATIVRTAFSEWAKDRLPLIIADCDVLQVRSIDIDVQIAMPESASAAEIRHERLLEGLS